MLPIELRNGPSGPDAKLNLVLASAQNFAQRLREENIHDLHLLLALLESSAITPEDNVFASAGVRKDTVFLAIQNTFGEGKKRDRRAATFTPQVRDLYESTIDQAANEGRLAGPSDLLNNLLQKPSTATKMVLNAIVQDHLRTNGTPNLAKARAEVWAYELDMPNISLLKPGLSAELPPHTDAFLRQVSMRMA